MDIQSIDYKGWPNSVRLANNLVDLVVLADVGPRIIRFGFIGEQNEFFEAQSTLGITGGGEWHNYGGHRLWAAPEAFPRSYPPDNFPVRVEEHSSFVRFTAPEEKENCLQKDIDVFLDDSEAQVGLVHRIRNTGRWTIELAPWALSVLQVGGTAFFPLPKRGHHDDNLLPCNSLVQWAYNDMSDPRWEWGHRFILVRSRPQFAAAQKLGAYVPAGWAAYARGGHLFLKQVKVISGAAYPDLNSNIEIYSQADILELESLGPLVRLEPGQTVEHIETWTLFKDIPQPETEADAAAIAEKLGLGD